MSLLLTNLMSPQSMSKVLDGNRSSAASAHVALANLRKEHDEEMKLMESKHKKSMAATRKQYNNVINQKNTRIRQLETQVLEMQQLCDGMAEEYYSMKNNAADSSKKEQRVTRTAEDRLQKVNTMQQTIWELQSTLDEERYANDMVLLENEWLKEQVDAIGNELIDAYHTIEVSNALLLLS
jgi:predicted RNase H-like nuclease (RuvC/YqgF family)